MNLTANQNQENCATKLLFFIVKGSAVKVKLILKDARGTGENCPMLSMGASNRLTNVRKNLLTIK